MCVCMAHHLDLHTAARCSTTAPQKKKDFAKTERKDSSDAGHGQTSNTRKLRIARNRIGLGEKNTRIHPTATGINQSTNDGSWRWWLLLLPHSSDSHDTRGIAFFLFSLCSLLYFTPHRARSILVSGKTHAHTDKHGLEQNATQHNKRTSEHKAVMQHAATGIHNDNNGDNNNNDSNLGHQEDDLSWLK